MKLILTKMFRNYLLLFISLISIEGIFRLVQKTTLWDWSFLRIFIGINIISLLIAYLLSFSNRRVGKIIVLLVVFILSFYATVQAGFLNFLGAYISFGTSSQLGAVAEFVGEYLNSFQLSYILIFIPFLLLLIYSIFFDRIFKPKNKINIQDYIRYIFIRPTVLVVLLGLVFSYWASLSAGFMINSLQLRSTLELFKNPSMPNIAVNQFGIISYGAIDIKSTIFSSPEVIELDSHYVAKETPKTDNSRIFDDYSWLELIENEKNSTFKMLNNYFISRDIPDKNEYTGLFEGKNLIVVMMESVNNVIINEEFYPTLWKLYNEGWTWTNTYSPRNACSTGNNEMSSMVSLFTINDTCTVNKYRNNTYFESIFNLFNRKDYTTSSYHNFNDTYYYRRLYHPNMGSRAYYDVSELGINMSSTYGEWPSDIELMEKAIPNFIEEEKFMSWIITVSSHHPYGSSTIGNAYADEFKNYTRNNSILSRYMSKLKYVDLALEKLLAELEKADKLKDTVIVLFADHYPYAIPRNTLQGLFDYNIGNYKEIDRTPFIIYNPDLTPTKFNEYTTFMNITPTLANLFNLDYDPRLYIGEDILDKNYSNIAVFADGSWQSDIAYYEATTGKVHYLSNVKYTNEEVIAINKTVNNKIKMSNLAIEKNYFEYLEKNLLKYPKTKEDD